MHNTIAKTMPAKNVLCVWGTTFGLLGLLSSYPAIAHLMHLCMNVYLHPVACSCLAEKPVHTVTRLVITADPAVGGPVQCHKVTTV